MNCNDFKKHISELIDNELERSAEQALREHLKNCANCEKEYSQLKKSVELLRTLDAIEPPPDIIVNVNNMLDNESTLKKIWGAIEGFIFYKMPYKIVATALIVILIAYMSYKNPPSFKQLKESAMEKHYQNLEGKEAEIGASLKEEIKEGDFLDDTIGKDVSSATAPEQSAAKAKEPLTIQPTAKVSEEHAIADKKPIINNELKEKTPVINEERKEFEAPVEFPETSMQKTVAQPEKLPPLPTEKGLVAGNVSSTPSSQPLSAPAPQDGEHLEAVQEPLPSKANESIIEAEKLEAEKPSEINLTKEDKSLELNDKIGAQSTMGSALSVEPLRASVPLAEKEKELPYSAKESGEKSQFDYAITDEDIGDRRAPAPIATEEKSIPQLSIEPIDTIAPPQPSSPPPPAMESMEAPGESGEIISHPPNLTQFAKDAKSTAMASPPLAEPPPAKSKKLEAEADAFRAKGEMRKERVGAEIRKKIFNYYEIKVANLTEATNYLTEIANQNGAIVLEEKRIDMAGNELSSASTEEGGINKAQITILVPGERFNDFTREMNESKNWGSLKSDTKIIRISDALQQRIRKIKEEKKTDFLIVAIELTL